MATPSATRHRMTRTELLGISLGVLLTVLLLPLNLTVWFGALLGVLAIAAHRLWLGRIGGFVRRRWPWLLTALVVVIVLAFGLFSSLKLRAPLPEPTPFKNYSAQVTLADSGMDVFNIDVTMDFDPDLLSPESAQRTDVPAQPVRLARYSVHSQQGSGLLLKKLVISSPRGQTAAVESRSGSMLNVEVCRTNCPDMRIELHDLPVKTFVSAETGQYEVRPSAPQHETVIIFVVSQDAEQGVVVDYVSPSVAWTRPVVDRFIGVASPGGFLGALVGLVIGAGSAFVTTVLLMAASVYGKRLLVRLHVDEPGEATKTGRRATAKRKTTTRTRK